MSDRMNVGEFSTSVPLLPSGSRMKTYNVNGMLEQLKKCM